MMAPDLPFEDSRSEKMQFGDLRLLQASVYDS